MARMLKIWAVLFSANKVWMEAMKIPQIVRKIKKPIEEGRKAETFFRKGSFLAASIFMAGVMMTLKNVFVKHGRLFISHGAPPGLCGQNFPCIRNHLRCTLPP